MKCLEHFPRHYVQDVFSADDLCKFLQQRLVLAPIPKPRSSSTTSKQATSHHHQPLPKKSPTMSCQLSGAHSQKLSSTVEESPLQWQLLSLCDFHEVFDVLARGVYLTHELYCTLIYTYNLAYNLPNSVTSARHPHCLVKVA